MKDIFAKTPLHRIDASVTPHLSNSGSRVLPITWATCIWPISNSFSDIYKYIMMGICWHTQIKPMVKFTCSSCILASTIELFTFGVQVVKPKGLLLSGIGSGGFNSGLTFCFFINSVIYDAIVTGWLLWWLSAGFPTLPALAWACKVSEVGTLLATEWRFKE